MKKSLMLCLFVVCTTLLVAMNVESSNTSSDFAPVVMQSEKYDVSPPLRTIKPIPPAPADTVREIPMRKLPKTEQSQSSHVIEGDGALNFWHGDTNMPATAQNFEGINNIYGVAPPDTNGDVGPNHYIQTVNLGFQIWNKSGTSLYGPANTNTIWTSFGGRCETDNDGDPIVLYDHLADRWLISQFSVSSAPYYQCIAISQTADPTGAWYRYAFQASATKMNDYPKFGVWPDGYYMSANQFTGGISWGGAGVFVFERSKMLTGAAAAMQYFDLESVDSCYGGLLPSDLDGTAPPAGTPNYFSSFDDGSWGCGSINDNLKIWEFHVDWTTPANSTFGLSGDPDLILTTAAFDPDMCGFSRDCISQLGTTQKVDAISDRLMYRLQYRNFGSYQAMVTNHTVDADGTDHAGIRWYELRKTTGDWSIYQQGTYAPDSNNRWMGSIAMDVQGNIALGYSISSSTLYPSIRYAGRLAGDPAGTLPQAEASLIDGTSYQNGVNRWGDYSSMSVDPSDSCTFWYTQEYYATIADWNWKTRIGSFKFSGCTTGPTGTLQGTVTDSSTTNPISGATITTTGGYSTITDGSGFYQFASMPVGTYDVTASVYGYQSSTETGVVITDGGTTIQDFALTPLSAATVQGTVTDGSGHGWPLFAQIDITAPGYSNTIYTDVTGQYSVNLLEGENYTFDVSATGYNSETRSVTPSAGINTEDFALSVDPSCTAPGYQMLGVNEQFESGTTPTGWTVVDNAGTGAVWEFNNPGERTNLTGGTGGFAIADSDNADTVDMNTSLITPVIDFTGQATVNLEFDTDFYYYSGGLSEVADVDVSNDGGSTFTNVWRKTASYRGPHHETVDISGIAGNQSNVKIQFHYYNANWEWWWQVDNVRAGLCQAISTGFVTGNVYDANTGSPISGATVADDLSNSTTTDSSGYYYFASAPGSRTLTASKSGYSNDVNVVTVVSDNIVQQDFNLPAVQLSANPTSLSVTVYTTSPATSRNLLISNTGGANATFDITEISGNAPINEGKILPYKRKQKTYWDITETAPAQVKSTLPNSWGAGSAIPTGSRYRSAGASCDGAAYYIFGGQTGTSTVLNETWKYDPAGNSWTQMANMPYALMSMEATCINGIIYLVGGYTGAAHTNNFLIYDTSGDTWTASTWPNTRTPMTAAWNGNLYAFGGNPGPSAETWVYDPATATWTGPLASMPTAASYGGATTVGDYILVVGGAATNDVQRYNPAANTWDATGPALPALRMNPILVWYGNYLYASSGGGLGGSIWTAFNDTLILDTSAWPAGTWTTHSETVPTPVVSAAYDCVNNRIYAAGGISAGGTTFYDVNQYLDDAQTCNNISDVPWLSEAPSTGAIAAGSSQNIVVSFDATGMAVGTYNAQIRVSNNSPYGTLTIPVSMTVITNPMTLVIWYYNSILNRAPEPGGAEGWTSEIERIASLGIDIKEGYIALGKLFFNSGEYLSMNTTNNAYVTDLYETFLGRTPTQGEADYWAGELSGGLTRNLLLNYFIFSAEFKSYMDGLFGDTSVRPEYNLVNDLYRGFLSRLPDDGGFNYWLGEMQTAQCNGDPQAIRDLTSQIALLFLNSQEYADRNTSNSEYIEDLYNGIMRRGADLAGYLYWLGELNGGTYTRAEMLQLFVDSTEFQGRVTEVINAGCSP